MFIQVIRGKAKDPAALRAQIDSWSAELQPGAIGFQGALSGLTQDGEWITMARFADAASARANSDRPEQDAWWTETAALFDGGATFTEGEDTDTFLDAPNASAGFVQVMVGSSSDRAATKALEAEATELLSSVHPALLGSVRLWQGDDYIEAAYFTNEPEARAGEATMGDNPQVVELMGRMQALGEIREFLDITDPVHLEA